MRYPKISEPMIWLGAATVKEWFPELDAKLTPPKRDKDGSRSMAAGDSTEVKAFAGQN